MYANFAFIAVILCSLFGGLIINQRFSRGSQFVISVALIVFVSFFIGYRSIDSGTDTREYLNYFQNVEYYSERFEPGFYFLTRLVKVFFEYELYFFVVCFLSLFCLLISCVLIGVNFFVFLGVMFSFMPGLDLFTNGIRNGLALSFAIMLITVTMFISKKLIVIGFASCISAAIHLSSFIFALFIPMTRYLSSSRKTLFCLYIVSIVLSYLCSAFGVEVIRTVAQPYGGEYGFIGKLSRYVLLDDELLSPAVKLYFYVISSCLVLFSLVHFRFLKNDVVVLFFKISMLGFFAFSILYFSAYSFRFILLFFFFQVLVCSYILSGSLCKLPSKLMFILFVLVNLLLTYSSRTFTSMNFLNIY